MAAHGEFNPTVLRQSPLGDIQVGHHLDARGDRERQVAGRGNQFVQHAVGLDSNAELVLEGLEVNVAGVFLDGRQEHDIQQLSHRSTVDDLGHQFDRTVPGQRLGRCRQVLILVQRIDDAFQALIIPRVVLVERLLHLAFGGHDRANFEAQERPHLVLNSQVLRIAGGDRQQVVFELDRNDPI